MSLTENIQTLASHSSNSEFSTSASSATPLRLQPLVSSEFSASASSATPLRLQSADNNNNTYNKNTTNEMNYHSLDVILEKEKNNNKNDAWNKIDKTEKIQKLHSFAEKYGRTHNLPIKDIKNMKSFFIECLEKLKLQKTKDVVYDKETREVTSIPALHFNINTHNFTLKIMDNKRVSTLKSLTPKRISNKNKEDDEKKNDETETLNSGDIVERV